MGKRKTKFNWGLAITLLLWGWIAGGIVLAQEPTPTPDPIREPIVDRLESGIDSATLAGLDACLAKYEDLATAPTVPFDRANFERLLDMAREVGAFLISRQDANGDVNKMARFLLEADASTTISISLGALVIDSLESSADGLEADAMDARRLITDIEARPTPVDATPSPTPGPTRTPRPSRTVVRDLGEQLL